MKFVTFEEKEYLKKLLLNNEVIAFPTETVFGLGAISTSEIAFNNLVKVKNRAPDKPFTLMCSNVNQISKYAYVDDLSKKIIDKFMPGSLTILLKAKPNIPYYIHLDSEFVGFRIPGNKELVDFIEYVEEPLLVPSANKSNEKPCLTPEEVKQVFDKEIEVCVTGKTESNIPSTIIKADNGIITLVREGTLLFSDILKEVEKC